MPVAAVYANSDPVPGGPGSTPCPIEVYAYCEPPQIIGDYGLVKVFRQTGGLYWKYGCFGQITLLGVMVENPATGVVKVVASLTMDYVGGESSHGCLIGKIVGGNFEGIMEAHGDRHVEAEVTGIEGGYLIYGEWWI